MLLRHYLRREAGGLLGWSLVTAVLALGLLVLYPVMMKSASMQEFNRIIAQMPAALRNVLGSGGQITALDGWLQAMVFGFLEPLLLVIYTALGVLGVLTREMDGHTLDFLLALPVRRSMVLLSRLGGLLLNLAALHGVLLLSVGLGVGLIGERSDWAVYALVLLNQYLIFAALAALLLLVTIFVDDLSLGLTTTLSVGLAMDFIPRMITPESPVAALRWLSLLTYFEPQQVLAHRALPWADVTVLVLVLAACTAAAVWRFDRKQLSA